MQFYSEVFLPKGIVISVKAIKAIVYEQTLCPSTLSKR